MNENLIVSLKDIVVDFDGQKVLDGLSLDIHDKEFVTFLGNSYNLNLGSAMSLVLMVIVLLCMSFTSSFDESEMEGVM